jgi:thiol-disulfide isomerase/thioredoxin
LYRATFRVEAGSGARDVLGVLEPSARIECVVLGLAHDPQRHVLELQAEGAQANIRWAPRLEQSKASWSFRSAPLPGGVLWRVWGSEVVFAQGYRATLFSELVRTQSGADEKLSLALSDGETIAGTVTGAQGEPASGVSVIVRKGTSERGAITDARGRYSVCGLPSGPCAVEVSRWTLRQLAGCGNGARDLYAQRELVLPLGVPSTGDFQLPESIVAPSAGELAPEFEVPTLSGGLLSLASLRGKVVLLEFWATWCGMCRAELPHLAEMYGELAAGGRFEIVGVSIDVDVELVPRYLASRKIRWPQLEPAPADENPVARAYNVNSTPANVLIGPDGKIVALNVTGAELRKRIDSLLR